VLILHIDEADVEDRVVLDNGDLHPKIRERSTEGARGGNEHSLGSVGGYMKGDCSGCDQTE